MYSLSQHERPASPYILNKIFSFDESGQTMKIEQMNQDQWNLSKLNCLNEKELILSIIKETSFNKNYVETNYTIKNAHLIKNLKSEHEYLNKQREMKANRSNVQEKFTYFITEDQTKLKDILNLGFTKSSSSINLLGASSNGIHLSKHLDIELEYRFKNKSKSFYCLMVKTLIGKTCLIEPSENNKSINPNFLADCHLSKEIATHSHDLETKRSNSLIYVYDVNKYGTLNIPIRNAIPYALIEFTQEQQRPILPKSSSYYNLAELMQKKSAKKQTNTVFEKTPQWRESYERTGNLIDLLKKYYKTVKSSPKLQPIQYIKRSQTFVFPDKNKPNLTTKSMSCLRDCLLIDCNLKPKRKELSNLKRRRSSSLVNERCSNDIDYYHAKRRYNADTTLEDLEFSTDYSYYSSFSSVFESSSENSSYSEKNKLSEEEEAILNEEDIVYLNDYSGEIFSSQSENEESQTKSNEENTNQNIIHNHNVSDQERLLPMVPPFQFAQQFNYSIPPPPLFSAYQPKIYYPFAFNPFLFYYNYTNYNSSNNTNNNSN